MLIIIYKILYIFYCYSNCVKQSVLLLLSVNSMCILKQCVCHFIVCIWNNNNVIQALYNFPLQFETYSNYCALCTKIARYMWKHRLESNNNNVNLKHAKYNNDIRTSIINSTGWIFYQIQSINPPLDRNTEQLLQNCHEQDCYNFYITYLYHSITCY